MFKLIGCFLVLIISFSVECWASEIPCSNPEPKIKNINELVTKSPFIGLYRAINVKSLPNQFDDANQQIYEVTLEQMSALKGDAPLIYRVKTLFPTFETIPISYFRIENNHEILVKKQAVLGLWSDTSSGMRLKSGICINAPQIVIDYEYLVFGNTTSPISVEPILNRHTDKLYIEVSEVSRQLDYNYDNDN